MENVLYLSREDKDTAYESDDDDKSTGDEYGYNSDDEMNNVLLSESRLQPLGKKKSKNNRHFFLFISKITSASVRRYPG